MIQDIIQELFPYIEGVTTNPFTHPDTDEAIEKGKIRQKQRALERRIRNDKLMVDSAKKIKDSPGVQLYSYRLKRHRLEIRNLVSDNSFLHRNYSREKVVINNVTDYNKTKLSDSQKYTYLKIKNGEWGKAINDDKQAPTYGILSY